jgi:hypothetical protein
MRGGTLEVTCQLCDRPSPLVGGVYCITLISLLNSLFSDNHYWWCYTQILNLTEVVTSLDRTPPLLPHMDPSPLLHIRLSNPDASLMRFIFASTNLPLPNVMFSKIRTPKFYEMWRWCGWGVMCPTERYLTKGQIFRKFRTTVKLSPENSPWPGENWGTAPGG